MKKVSYIFIIGAIALVFLISYVASYVLFRKTDLLVKVNEYGGHNNFESPMATYIIFIQENEAKEFQENKPVSYFYSPLASLEIKCFLKEDQRPCNCHKR